TALGEIVATLHESQRRGGVGADVIERDHLDAPFEVVGRLERRAGLLARRLGDVRAMALLATLLEELLAARGLVAIDGAEYLLRPAWRPQPLQRVLDALQSGDVNRAAEPRL